MSHADETFVDFPGGFGIRAVIDEAFAATGVERVVPFEVATYEALAGLVRHGLGIAFLPRPAARAFGDLHPLDVKGVALSWTISAATVPSRRLSAAGAGAARPPAAPLPPAAAGAVAAARVSRRAIGDRDMRHRRLPWRI